MKNLLIISVLTITLFSCKKNNSSSSNNSNSWDVKYTVTIADVNTKVSVTYSDNTGSYLSNSTGDSTNFPHAPWTYEANYSKDPGLPSTERNLVLLLMGATPSNSTTPVLLSIYVDGQLKIQVDGRTAFHANYTLIP